MRPDPIIPQYVLDQVREQLTQNHDEDTIAVVVLAGTPERGLGLSVSSAQDEEETIQLLAHALVAEPIARGWVDDEETEA